MLMKAAVWRHIAETQKRYKNSYQKKVRREPQMHVGDELYIHCPQHASFAFDFAEEYCSKVVWNLMQPMGRPNKVAQAQLHTVLIDECGVQNRVAIDRMTPDLKSSKDAKPKTNIYNSSLSKRAPIPEHLTNGAVRSENDKRSRDTR